MLKYKIKNHVIALLAAIALTITLICTIFAPYYSTTSDSVIEILPSNYKNAASSAFETRIASIEIDGEPVDFDLSREEPWKLFNNFLTHYDPSDSTPYMINMGKAELCTITFIKKNDSGIITLIVNNTREDIDLYSENQWETYTWTYKNPYTFTFFENYFFTLVLYFFVFVMLEVLLRYKKIILYRIYKLFPNRKVLIFSTLLAISLVSILSLFLYYAKNYTITIVGEFYGNSIQDIYWDNDKMDEYPFSGGENIGTLKSKRLGTIDEVQVLVPQKASSKLRIDFLFEDNEKSQVLIKQVLMQNFYHQYIVNFNELYHLFYAANGAKIELADNGIIINYDLSNSRDQIPHIYTHNFYYHEANKNYTVCAYIKIILSAVIFIIIFYSLLSFFHYSKNKKLRFQILLQLINLFLFSLLFHFFMIIIMQSDFQQAIVWIHEHLIAFLQGGFILCLITLCVWAVIRNSTIAATFTGILSFVISIINQYKMQYQGKPLAPWDYLKINEVKSISSGLRLEISNIMILTAMLIIICIIMNIFWPKIRITNKRVKYVLSIFLLIFTGISGSMYIYKTFWNPDLKEIQWDQEDYYKENGLINSFLANCRYIAIEKPAGYCEETVYQICNELEKDAIIKKMPQAIDQPDIIVIMSEGFWDITNLKGITFEEEVLPNLKALKNESLYGYTMVPVFGGGTSNTEWEVLTGFSKNYLPSESTPYQQYINGPSFSVASYLKKQGYDTLAMHPHFPENWNRNTAYPYLGFDQFLSLNDFTNPLKERNLVSDYTVTNKIISEYKKYKSLSNHPLFTFVVTVQNHVSYDHNNYTTQDQIKFSAPFLSEDIINDIKDFATGIHHSDDALGKLIDYFKNVNNKVIIVFFCDHMTTLGDSTFKVFEETGYISNSSTNSDEYYKTMLTPLLIWSNYDSESKDIGIRSSFQIMPTVFQKYLLTMPAYYELLCEIQKYSNGFTNGIVLDQESQVSSSLTQTQEELYRIQELLQYDMMFGDQYSKEKMFE